MEKYIDYIVIVEGSNDASFVSSVYDCEVVSLNGCELKNIKYLTKVSKIENVIIFTDPDTEGEAIRSKLHEKLDKYIDVYVDKKDCSKGKKTGVFECDKGKIIDVLKPYCSSKEKRKNDKIPYLESKQRNIICKELDIENCNFKTFKKRMIRLNINNEKICDILEK